MEEGGWPLTACPVSPQGQQDKGSMRELGDQPSVITAHFIDIFNVQTGKPQYKCPVKPQHRGS